MINPFDNEYQGLVHLASGSVATASVTNDMKTMLEKGECAAVEFMESNIVGEEPDIYTKIKKTQLQTFSLIGKKVNSKSKKGEIVALKNSKALFAKMLLIAKSRNLEMEEVLTYSLRPYPHPLATNEGDLVKTVKAKLLNMIENEVQDGSVDLPVGDKAYIFDAMAILQTLTVLPATFGELATDLLAKIVNTAVSLNFSRVDFVCDRYPEKSIKNLERDKRAVGGTNVIRIYSEQQRVPRQWKKFMASGENKEEIMKFIFNTWRNADPRALKGVEVLLAHEDKCHKLTELLGDMSCTEIEELSSDHEEADTRMIAHARHASMSYSNVIIKSPDTDVFLIALNAINDIFANLFFETGKGNARRIISLNKTKQHIGEQWCSSLIGFHAFTGCDTTSAFYGKGKVKALKIARMNDEYAILFGNLGKTVTLSTQLKNGLYGFVCHLYGYEGRSDVNSVRYEMFKGGKYDEELLPPNQDSLDNHISRANYQSYIWRHAMQPILRLPNFCDHGWKLDEEGNVTINWMSLAPAPDSILEFVNCKCKKGCENNRCSCVKAVMKCSDLCKCTGCKNISTDITDSLESDSDTYNSPDECSSSDNSDDEN